MGRKGLLVVISAPSGGGKTTVIRRVLASGNGNFKYSISATTRRIRAGEVDGQDYHFLSLEGFKDKKEQGKFVEWAEVHGNYYATPRKPIEKWLNEGKTVFLDLDVNGGLEVKKYFNDSALLIFIKPPSVESLVQRLRGRKTETQHEIDKRLKRVPEEMHKSQRYDYQILNEDLDNTKTEILEIIRNHNCQH
ncbi:guanylate kinase [candidate division KSB1 bacterium]|nr:guanylate kinase [candidate division KSB1 bacterium]MCH7753522.1 guanylate kinase [candidate division KSB1 bacterium]MCH8981794.1 guanylate kinase [candidate division KSB1 bacterium]